MPIIAIQLSAIKYDNKIMPVFTRVLDIYEEPEEEGTGESEVTDRPYWENRSNEKSLMVFDEVIKEIKKIGLEPRITYNKGHIAIGTNKRNFAWFHPKKKETYCHFDIRVGDENIEKIKDLLNSSEIPFFKKKTFDQFALQLRFDDLKKKELFDFLKIAWSAYE